MITRSISVPFTRTVMAIKGGKCVAQQGVNISKKEDDITIYCLNKKDGGITTRLRIEIPMESLDSVIEALKQMKS